MPAATTDAATCDEGNAAPHESPRSSSHCAQRAGAMFVAALWARSKA